MKTNLSLIEDNDDYFEIKTSKRKKSPYSIINLKKSENNLIETLSFYTRNLPNIYNKISRNKYNTYNIDISKFKNVSLHNDMLKQKTRNKTMKNLFKCKSENDLTEKINKNDNIITSKKNNFLLLTSLYKLPSISNKNKLVKKPQSPNHFKLGQLLNNNNLSSNNSSILNNKQSFNDSVNTSSYNESFNNYINFKYSNEISKNNNVSKELNQSKSIGKKKVFSNLNASLKDKYYSDIEKRLNYKLDEKLFPSDHSMKDKIIHMKKVSIFWNSVFKYCIPIINGQKYKLQHMKSQEKELEKLDVNNNKYSNYYNIFMKDNNVFKINKSQSQKNYLFQK
jgi:hypothetical protein